MYQTNTLYTLNLQDVTCQLYISPSPKKGGGGGRGHFPSAINLLPSINNLPYSSLVISLLSNVFMSSCCFGHFVNNLLVVICERTGPKVATRSLSDHNSIIILILNTISKSEILNTLNKKVNRTATPKKELRDSVPYFHDPDKCPKIAIQGLRDDPDVLRLLRHWLCGCFYFFSLFSML